MKRRGKTRKFFAVVCIVCLITGMPVFAETEPAFLDQPAVQPARSLGTPFWTDETYILKCAATVQDGVPVAVTVTSGTPGVMNVVNLETGKRINYIELEEGETYWIIETDSKGKVYFASYNKPCKLYRYDPADKQLRNLGEIPGTSALISLAFDDNDNVYLGTFPNAAIVKYDVASDSFTNYGNMRAKEHYLQGLAYHTGKLYYCFSENPGLYSFDPVTGQKKEMPSLPGGYVQTGGMKMFARGEYILAFVTAKKNGGSEKNCLFFYDIATGKWKDQVIDNIYGSYISDLKDGAFYYRAADSFSMFRFDMSTFTSTKTLMTFGSYIRGTDFVEVQRPDVAGTCLVNAQYNGRLYLMHLETGKMVTYEGMLKGGPTNIRRIAFDDQNRLYATEYMGTKGVRWDFTKPEGEQMEYYHMSQGDSICQVDGWMLFGNYTGATIYQMDLKKPVFRLYDKNNPDMNPVIVGSIGERQDRPTVMKEAAGKALIGSIPDYEDVGGALTVYDPETKKSQVYRNLIPEQSVTGLCYEDGIVYGSSSVACGLDTDPTKEQAEVFRFDMSTGTLLSHKVPNLSGFSKPVGGIGDVNIGPDGLLWAATTGMVFAMNKDTLEVVKQIPLTNESQPNSYKQYWWPKSVLFGKYGHLYVSDGGRLRIIDPLTGESRLTEAECGTCFVMDKDEQIYFYSGTEVKKTELTYRADAQKAAEIKVSGEDKLEIPAGSTPNQTQLSAAVKDRFGNLLDSAVQWKLKEEYPGVSVSEGTVQVSREAQAGEITVVAADGRVSAEHKITLRKPEISVSIEAVSTVSIPTGSTPKQVALKAIVKDRDGNRIDAPVTWDLLEGYAGVSLEGNLLKVSRSANAGTVVVRAKAGDAEASLSIALEKKSSGSGGGNGGGGGGGSVSRPNPTPIPVTTPKPEETQKPTEPPVSFADLEASHWAYGSVQKLVKKGIVKGYEDGSFRPDDSITREEFVKVIVESFSIQPEAGALPFADVKEEDWSYPYLCAAVRNGLIQGVSAEAFGYGQNVTREDAAVILERALSSQRITLTDESEKIHFADEAELADYAKGAVEKMQRAGILNGFPDGRFAPKEQAARAEVCAMVGKLLEKIEE